MTVSEKNNEGICCPICGERTVYATVHTTMVFTGTHYVCTNGLEYDTYNMGAILGKPAHEPLMTYAGFFCESCGKEWSNSMIKLCSDNSGNCHFEETSPGNIEKIKKRKNRKRRT